MVREFNTHGKTGLRAHHGIQFKINTFSSSRNKLQHKTNTKPKAEGDGFRPSLFSLFKAFRFHADFTLVLVICIPGKPCELHTVCIIQRSRKVFAVFTNDSFTGYRLLRGKLFTLWNTDLFSVQSCSFNAFLRPLVQVLHFLL